MSAGLPIITSNFPLWKEIVEGNNCGICVNPLEPKEIAEAIEYIMTHPNEAEQMGQNGKKDEVCYVGGIAQIRGIKEVVKSMEFTTKVKLNLVGAFSEKAVEEETKSYVG